MATLRSGHVEERMVYIPAYGGVHRALIQVIRVSANERSYIDDEAGFCCVRRGGRVMERWMRKCLFGVMIAALLGTPTSAQSGPDREQMRTSGNQLSDDLVTCAAFFMISAQGIDNRGDAKNPGQIDKMRDLARRTMRLAEMASKSIGEEPEALAARAEAVVPALMAEMGGNYLNYSFLSRKYLRQCINLTLGPKNTGDDRKRTVDPNLRQ